ncbi:MAG: ABC-2 type transport system ATP-binding protein [Pseudohongiellaceae bacterium]|jgi:ABC-2 type transport system ATP-binding protein
MTESVLKLDNVVKTYGDFTAVDGISLEIPKGSIYGFLGPNGAGKTTTIRMILDIVKPSSGRITLLGHSCALDVRNRIGYLPEEKGLYKKMKVWAIIQYFARLKGMEKKAAKHKAFALLERYGLIEFADAKIESLSKGMGQKVQVLSAVAHDPEFVILDEPFSGLDPVNQTVLEDLITDMASNGQTVIFSTHVMQHAERLCDRILLISKGKKIFDGTVAQARATIPRRVLISSESDISPLQQLSGVQDITATEHNQWRIDISKDVNPQHILEFCANAKIAIRGFEFSESSLHDVFVNLVGDDAKEHVFR